MKKRMGLFLIAVALVTTALASRPVAAQRLSFCHPQIACLIGPVCCTDAHCAGFCDILSPGSVPHCSDPDGGCCSCEIVE